ncbi:MAG: hypothetical protein AMXMBFR7_33600 [Planctomycetota bacterium]
MKCARTVRSLPKLWGIPAFLVCVGLAWPLAAEDEQALLESAEEAPAEEMPPIEPVQVVTSAVRTVVENEDGSKTVTSTATHANTATGAERSVENTVTVTPSESGSTYTRDTIYAGANGGAASSHTDCNVTRNGDGSGSFSSSTSGSGTRANGQPASWNTERSGTWAPNSQGGKDASMTATTTMGSGFSTTVNRTAQSFQVDEDTKGFHAESDRTNSLGGSTQRVTDGSVTKTETGREWESTTTGTHTNRIGETASWSAERDGSVTKNEDGSLTLSKTQTVTNAKGETVNIEKSGTLVKTETGHAWEGTGSATYTGAEGQQKSWTGTGSGSTTRNGDGTGSAQSTRTVTNDQGQSRSVDRTGTSAPAESGAGRTWEGTKSVSRSGAEKAPPAETSATARSTQAASTDRAGGRESWAARREAAASSPATGIANDSARRAEATQRLDAWKAQRGDATAAGSGAGSLRERLQGAGQNADGLRERAERDRVERERAERQRTPQRRGRR